MTNQVTNVAAVKSTRYGGGLLSSALGIPAPTDATTDPDVGFTAVSLIGDDGLTDAPGRTSDDVRDINGDIVLTVQTEYGLKVSFTLLERTLEALKEVYGQGNVTETVDGVSGATKRVIKYNSDELPHRQWILQLKGKAGRTVRKFYPDAQIVELSEVKYAKKGPVAYACTMTAYPDENGNCQYEYEDIPAEA